jgi:hypothetical protein
LVETSDRRSDGRGTRGCKYGCSQRCGHTDTNQRTATSAARRKKAIRSALSPEEELEFLTAMGMDLDC